MKENIVLEQIGKKLKQLRIDKGYTSHEIFAYENELNRVQYWKWESGKANLTIKSLVKLLNIHGITLEEFFKEM